MASACYRPQYLIFPTFPACPPFLANAENLVTNPRPRPTKSWTWCKGKEQAEWYKGKNKSTTSKQQQRTLIVHVYLERTSWARERGGLYISPFNPSDPLAAQAYQITNPSFRESASGQKVLITLVWPDLDLDLPSWLHSQLTRGWQVCNITDISQGGRLSASCSGGVLHEELHNGVEVGFFFCANTIAADFTVSYTL